ncbi:hypothetical protein ACFE04_004846 [Oxalis oulophora]
MGFMALKLMPKLKLLAVKLADCILLIKPSLDRTGMLDAKCGGVGKSNIDTTFVVVGLDYFYGRIARNSRGDEMWSKLYVGILGLLKMFYMWHLQSQRELR